MPRKYKSSDSYFKGKTRVNWELSQRDRQELEYHRSMSAQLPFVNELTKMLGTLMVHTPRTQWCKDFEVAFQHAARKCPSGAQEYLKHLPK